MFSVMVKESARNKLGTNGLVWVKDDKCQYYVSKKDRGVWGTKEEAQRMITEHSFEVVVDIGDL